MAVKLEDIRPPGTRFQYVSGDGTKVTGTITAYQGATRMGYGHSYHLRADGWKISINDMPFVINSLNSEDFTWL